MTDGQIIGAALIIAPALTLLAATATERWHHHRTRARRHRNQIALPHNVIARIERNHGGYGRRAGWRPIR